MKTVLYTTGVLSLLGLTTAYADWRSQVGWNELQARAGLTLPSTSVVKAAMAEATGSGGVYMPNTGEAMFAGKSITNKSNKNSGVSSHANTVAKFFFSSTNSLCQDLVDVDVFERLDYKYQTLGYSGSQQVDAVDYDVMAHAYIATYSSGTTTNLITRADFLTQESKTVNIYPLNNGAGSAVPTIWGCAYNGISVGITNGNHSAGETPSGQEGAGRQKPDVVCPFGATSWSTGGVASVAGLLKAKAYDMGGGNALEPMVIKSVIMAGATKDEFASWSQTSAKPLDALYGAGEVNIDHSYRIFENTESAPGAVNQDGWDHASVSSSTSKVYTINYDASVESANLSAVICWERGVNENKSGSTYTYSYAALSDLSLTLRNAQGSIIFESDSAKDNVEHVWATGLSAGTYTLTVESATGSATDFSIAWRSEVAQGAPIVQEESTPGACCHIDINGEQNSVSYTSLTESVEYTVQRSTDLVNWSNAHTFVADNTGTYQWEDTNGLVEKAYYRLAWNN